MSLRSPGRLGEREIVGSLSIKINFKKPSQELLSLHDTTWYLYLTVYIQCPKRLICGLKYDKYSEYVQHVGGIWRQSVSLCAKLIYKFMFSTSK